MGDGGPATSAGLAAPRGIAVDRDDNIYVTSVDRVRVLTPAIGAQAASLSITRQPGDPVPPAQAIVASYGSGNATITASVTSGAPWLSVTPSTSAPSTFLVSVNPASLFPALYTGNVRLIAAKAVTDVPATFAITSGCTSSLSPADITFPSQGGPRSFTVTTGANCSYTMATPSWARFSTGGSALTGTGSATYTVIADPNPGPARAFALTFFSGSGLGFTQSAAPGIYTALRFVPLIPCRIIDTRPNSIFTASEIRSIHIPSSQCNVPATAAAYSLNVTVVPSGTLSFLTLWPGGLHRPQVSTLNSFDGRIKANAAIIPAGINGAVNVFVTNPTHVILDVKGYFTNGTGASFYPIPPCRITDTRPNATLAANQSRTIDITASSCNIPSNATAYSLNFTAVPNGPLGHLTTWPNGQPQPLVSTLDVPTGAVAANAAIVPAGASGSINVFVTNPTDMVIDSNGYFAPSGGANERVFYPVTPCRIIDTRLTSVMTAAETRTINVSTSPCNIPSTAKSFSLNATVVPTGPLSYLTLWPAGTAQPLVSTLNAFDGAVTSNAAIVPAAGHTPDEHRIRWNPRWNPKR